MSTVDIDTISDICAIAQSARFLKDFVRPSQVHASRESIEIMNPATKSVIYVSKTASPEVHRTLTCIIHALDRLEAAAMYDVGGVLGVEDVDRLSRLHPDAEPPENLEEVCEHWDGPSYTMGYIAGKKAQE